jgi:CspA family cold shock protein
MDGVIKKLMADKGFGFIRGTDGVERFFHRQDCESPFEEMEEGRSVTFAEGRPGPKGPRADVVRIAE